MNIRDRFLAAMRDFDPGVPVPRWEFGYWGGTINNWYASGLPRKNPAIIPTAITTVSSSIYTRSWTTANRYVRPGGYPNGYAIMAGGLYWPTQGFALDSDVRDFFAMDASQRLVDLDLFFHPHFDIEVIEEDEERLQYRDIDGVVRMYLKESATMASGWIWPIRDWPTWRTLKDERLRLDDIRKRLPGDWASRVREYRDRDYPLGMGGYPLGFFGTLVHLIGYESLFLMYYDDPALIHDIVSSFTDLWIAIFEEVLAEVEVDHVQIWEDISFGSGCMLPHEVMREFMLPYYKRFTSFLKGRGVDLIFVDTDGDCNDVIPFFVEAGATGMLPFEANCGMDIVKVRREFPRLALMGGIPKSEIQKGQRRIDEILAPVGAVLATGGYIPFADHFVPPEVGFEQFTYDRCRLNGMIDEAARARR